MSSRQLRKLQKQKELEQVQAELADSNESEDDVHVPAPRAKPNLFAALGGEDDNEDDDHDEDEADAEPEPELTPVDPAPSSKKSKKKKKKKKAKAKAEAVEVEDEDEEEEDEIDKAMKALNIKVQTGSASLEAQQTARSDNELFSINPYHLKAINEMRNLFGREVIEAADAEEEQENSRRGRRQQMPRQVDLETFLREPPGAPKLPEVSLRRNLFIQGKENWPKQSAGGLTMKEIETAPDGSSTEYAYVHDPTYDGMQMFFFACVQIGDPMRMVHLLKQAPYHVSTLLQVSFVAKQDQNMALSSELCERALFTFGRVTTSAFRQKVEQGKARLNFYRPENRQFWLAGYHYLRSLLRKGTYRTALEWAKLMFALDHKDPFGMRHYIHFLAVRAYESKWLLNFLDFLQRTSEGSDAVYIEQTRVLALLQLGDNDGARAALKKGIETVPWLYCALFQELNLDAPPSIWGINANSDARQFWVKLYIYLAKDLWNNTQATSLLQEIAKGMDKVDVSGLAADDETPGLDATRLAYLEGQTGLLSVAPRELLDRQPNYEFDPMPPSEEENIFTGKGTRLPWKDMHGQSEGEVNEAMARLQNVLARQQARRGGPAGVPVQGAGVLQGADPDNSDADYESDEELRRDLEEHARRSNEPGMLGNLMNMLGLGGAQRGEGDDAAAGDIEEDEYAYEDEEEVPGAWRDDQ